MKDKTRPPGGAARRLPLLVAALVALALGALLLSGCGALTPGAQNGSGQGRTGEPIVLQPPPADGSRSGGESGSSSGGGTAQPGPSEPTIAIKVFFTKYASPTAPSEFVPVTRQVPRSKATIRGALEELLKGPTAEEKAAGLTSWFSEKTAGMVRGVSLKDGRAVVDFEDISKVIPNASTSEGSRTLLGELGSTVAQFSNVREIEYRINGDNAAFMGWLQRGAGAVPAGPWR
ncbi:MAG: GerMN domain-containing protein [Symbiobacteriia bacterium]